MSILSPGFTGEGDYVVGFEAVNDAAVLVFGCELGRELLVGEVGGEVCETACVLAEVSPDLVAGVEEVTDDCLGVDAVKGTVVDADVIET